MESVFKTFAKSSNILGPHDTGSKSKYWAPELPELREIIIMLGPGFKLPLHTGNANKDQ
jgi:hypothetical protein